MGIDRAADDTAMPSELCADGIVRGRRGGMESAQVSLNKCIVV
jgi:hypothetical protein